MRFTRSLLLSFGVLYSFSSPIVGQSIKQAQVRPVLINQDIEQMARSRFADSTIIKLIRANDTNFDLSVPAMIKLKNSGVSQAVIETMISAGTNRKAVGPVMVEVAPQPALPPVAPLAKNADLPDEIGVYVRRHGELIAIEPEIVNWRTGGVIKNTVTLGLDKQHVNGTVRKPHSSLDLSSGNGRASAFMGASDSLEFYIRCPDGDSASEYQLLHFWEKADRREFRTVTGGVLHASGGAQDNVLDFTFEKVAPRTYKVQLKGLAPGEYGFLAPGTTASANAASQGKTYTFRIAE
jgi:hypothetical protein